MQRDRHRLRRRLKRLARQPDAAAREQLAQAIEASAATRQARLDNLPRVTYPEELPVSGRREAIREALEQHQVIIVCGETGSGKTTQLPKICLEAGRGVNGYIGHTQPRRIAARAVATRIAEEMNTPLGAQVGFKVRFSEHVSAESYVKLMTDGILLAEIQHDRFLDAYDTLIIDEAHERSLNIDFLLGYLRQLLPRRPDLKVIITSATIDPERFAKHFGDAPIIEVSGRTYPVEVRYRPLHGENEDERDRDLQQAIREAVDELAEEGLGDILVFLPGEREIRETAESLRKHHPKHTEILPLYARLSASEQNRVFAPHTGRRIVLATNVAETSLTVPGIRYVIDTGLARLSRYSWRAKVQRLPIEPVSQASANQRKGRCGRVAEGICIRLYSEDDFNNRPEFTDPEILRTNLASVILQMAQLGLGEPGDFPFVEPPDSRLIKDGYNLLHELNAVDAGNRITPLGKKIAQLPIDPRLARMLLAAQQEGCLREALIIVSALSIQDPRERPHDFQQAADEKHKRFADEHSDFLAHVNLWDYLHEQMRHLTQNKLRKLCRDEFISYIRLREWHDVHRQLRAQLKDMGVRENEQPAEYAPLHRALLTGLLGNIGYRDEDREFMGARNRKFLVFPGSGLSKKPPKWLMAAELVETSRLFARTVAKIEPQWVEELAAHLIHHHYYEPHWQRRRAQVGAYDRLTLYGLVINPNRRVNYSQINPKEAREIFIRHALVYGEYETKAPFFLHNRQLIEDVEDLEARSRRRDIMVDEETLYGFYDRRLPADVCNGPGFEAWRREIERDDPQALFFTREEVMQHTAAGVTAAQFPDVIDLGGLRAPVSYHFEPGSDEDGVTVTLPVGGLNQVDAARADWLVPGLIEEKLTALIRGLPKALRRHFVPAPDFARACLEALTPGETRLTEALAARLKQMTGVDVPPGAWAEDQLEPHLRLRYRVVDASGGTLAAGRDLDALQAQLGGRIAEQFETLQAQAGTAEGLEREGLTAWDFGALPETVEIEGQGIRMTGYPALIDEKDTVALRVLDNPEEAREATRDGILRLARLALAEQEKHLAKNLPGIDRLCLQFATVGNCQGLKEDILRAAFTQALFADGWPTDAAGFAAALEAGRGELFATAETLCGLLATALAEFNPIRQRIKKNLPFTWIDAVADIRDQLDHLVYPGFVTATPVHRLRQLPRYLKAISRRLDRLESQPDKDRHLRIDIEPLWEDCKRRLAATREPDAALLDYRWQIEELRVSLFAQELGTERPVSVQRLEKQRKAL